jgi:hypothetical protein
MEENPYQSPREAGGGPPDAPDTWDWGTLIGVPSGTAIIILGMRYFLAIPPPVTAMSFLVPTFFVIGYVRGRGAGGIAGMFVAGLVGIVGMVLFAVLILLGILPLECFG